MTKVNTFFKQLLSHLTTQKVKRYSHFSVDSIFSLETAYNMGFFYESLLNVLIARNSSIKNVNCQISFVLKTIKGIQR